MYRQHGERLWRSVFLFTAEREVTSDAIAEAFAQALRRGDAIRSPLAWITRAAFRIAGGELKERRRRVELSATPSNGAFESTVELVEALRRLPDKQRAAIILRFYAGFSHGEIARMTGSTSGAVAVNVHRARRRLHELLGETDA